MRSREWPEPRARSTLNCLRKQSFTIKPSKFKIRIVACGNKTDETFGRTSTTVLDTGMMRYLVSWAASLPNLCLASLDVTAAFLNAPLPTGRVVVLRPPAYPLQTQSSTSWSCMACPQGHLRSQRSSQPLVRRANGSSQEVDFYQWWGELCHTFVINSSILVSHCATTVFTESHSIYGSSRSHLQRAT